ncbi:hypothetical protein ACVW2L_003971 [Mucilaginibacter sp. HD30]
MLNYTSACNFFAFLSISLMIFYFLGKKQSILIKTRIAVPSKMLYEE